MTNTIKTTQLLELPEGINKADISNMILLACQGGVSIEVSNTTWEKIEKANTILVRFLDGLYVVKSRNINSIENIKFKEYTTFNKVPVDSVGLSYILNIKRDMLFSQYISFYNTYIA